MNWYLLKNDETHGPYAHELIIDMIHAKEIDLISLIRKESEESWSIVSDRQEFSQLFTDELLDFEVGNQWVLLKKINNDWLQYGPFTDLQVEVMLKHGKIKYSDWVWKTGFKRWYQVYSLSEFTSKENKKSEDSQRKHRSQLDDKKILSEVFLMESPDIVSEYGVQNVSLLRPPEDLTKQDLKEHLIKKVIQPRKGRAIDDVKVQGAKKNIKLNTFKNEPGPIVRGGSGSNWKFLSLALCSLLFVVIGAQWLSSKRKKYLVADEARVEVTKKASFLGLEIKNTDKPSASVNVASDVPVQLEIRSVPGYNLNNKSFIYEKTFNEAGFILLNNFNLKPGQYWVRAKADGRVKTDSFFLGKPTADYLARLWMHNKKMSAFHQNEKELLYNDAVIMENSLIQLAKHFNQENNEDFKLTIEQGWGPNLKSEISKVLISWEAQKATNFVHPGLWVASKAIYDELLVLSKNYDATKASEILDKVATTKLKVSSLSIGSVD